MRKENYHSFFLKYLDRQHTEAEHREFLAWFGTLSAEQAGNVIAEYEQLANGQDPDEAVFPDHSLIAGIESRLDEWEATQQTGTSRSWMRFLPRFAAAAIIMLGLGWSYVTFYKRPAPEETRFTSTLPDVEPGDYRGVLTLSDGSAIVLSDKESGEIARTKLVSINKEGDGQLSYAPTEKYRFANENLTKEYNTLATPKSGQYKLLLPDGTKVWLNSMSTLRFPVTFDPVERTVELSGEAYFEVAKATSSGRRIPFRVMSNGQIIEVTGTKFNVNTYSDDSFIKTTLLEGGVNVKERNTGSMVKLKPGEQSLVLSGTYQKSNGRKSVISVRKADIEGDLAWTNGYFHFRDSELREVMQQLVRWYDIEVEYVGNTSGERFNGFVSREVSLSNVLTMLEQGSDVRFELSNKAKVKVFPAPDTASATDI